MQQYEYHVSNIEQKSEEWLALRLGKITASGFCKLVGTAASRDKYLYDKAAEIVTGESSDSDEVCTNIHIRRGNEWEGVARDKYIVHTFSEVVETGFIQLSPYIGCSPDGLVGQDGLIEIKVPDSNNYFRSVLEISQSGITAISSDHMWQMQFCMYVTNRAWCDYVLYNPKHDTIGKGLFIIRVEKDASAQQRIKEVLAASVVAIKSYVDQYQNGIKVN